MITILGYRLLSWTVFYVHERFLRIYKVAPDKLSKRLKLWKKTHTHTYIYIAYERAHTHIDISDMFMSIPWEKN